MNAPGAPAPYQMSPMGGITPVNFSPIPNAQLPGGGAIAPIAFRPGAPVAVPGGGVPGGNSHPMPPMGMPLAYMGQPMNLMGPGNQPMQGGAPPPDQYQPGPRLSRPMTPQDAANFRAAGINVPATQPQLMPQQPMMDPGGAPQIQPYGAIPSEQMVHGPATMPNVPDGYYPQGPQGYAQQNMPGIPGGYYNQQLVNAQPGSYPTAPNYDRIIRSVQPQESKTARFLHGLGAALSPQVAAQQRAMIQARGKLQHDLIDEYGKNYRQDMRSSEAYERAALEARTRMAAVELQTAAQGRPKPSDGYRAFNQAMKIPLRTMGDLQQQAQLLQFASEATGQDLTGFTGVRSSQAADEAQHRMNQLVRDAQQMAEAQNRIQMEPIENQQKQLNAQKAQQQYKNEQLEGQLKQNRLNDSGLLHQARVARATTAGNQAQISDIKLHQLTNPAPYASEKENQEAQLRQLQIKSMQQKLHDIADDDDDDGGKKKPAENRNIMNDIIGGAADGLTEFFTGQEPQRAVASSQAFMRPPYPGMKANVQVAKEYIKHYGGDYKAAQAAAWRDGWDTKQ
jgi:hypothetical protein